MLIVEGSIWESIYCTNNEMKEGEDEEVTRLKRNHNGTKSITDREEMLQIIQRKHLPEQRDSSIGQSQAEK